MTVWSTLSSYSMASQVKVTEQKQLIDELRKELELARATHSAGHPLIRGQTQVCITSGTPGTHKTHSSQQLVGTAKEPRSLADVANGTLPKQGTSAKAQAQDQGRAKAQARVQAHSSSQPQPHAGTGVPWSNNHG